MPLGGGLILGGLAAGKVIGGLFGNASANKAAKANVRPPYIIPPEYTDNLRMAQQMAQIGLPQQQYNNAQNGINRNLAGGLSILGRSANPGAGLASLLRARNDSQLSLDVQDANARQGNQRLVMNANNQMAGQKLAQQDWNQFKRYEENAAAIRGQKAAARQNIFGGLSDLATLGVTLMDEGNSDGSSKSQNQQSSTPSLYNQPQVNPYNAYGTQQPFGFGSSLLFNKR